MAFLCVCPEKSLEFGADAKVHRSEREQFVRGVLESVSFALGKKAILTLPGGGIAVQYSDDTPKIASDVASSTIAALTGSIQNYAYLVKKYLQHELRLPTNVTLEAIRERMPVSVRHAFPYTLSLRHSAQDTELLCKLYAQLGTGMISKLRGQFSFCIYDSTTVRVLAGTDCSGSVPLVQGKLSDNSLFVASENVYPGDAHDIEPIPAGHYKYGWHAMAIKYANTQTAARHSAEQASSAADAALAGLFCKTADSTLKSRRASLDSANLKSHTLDPNHRQESLGNRRHSMDATTTKADGKDWWRTNQAKSGNPRKNNPRKNNKKGKKKQPPLPTTFKTPSTAEEFINTLGGVIRKDAASVSRLMNLLAESPYSIVVTDARDENIVFVNRSFEEQTGYRSDDVVGKNCRFLQAPHGASVGKSTGSNLLRRLIDEGHAGSARLINYKRDGTPVLNECSIVPLRDSEGNITHHVGMHKFEPLSDGVAEDVRGHVQTPSMIVRSRSCGDVAAVVNVTTTSVTMPSNNVAF